MSGGASVMPLPQPKRRAKAKPITKSYLAAALKESYMKKKKKK